MNPETMTHEEYWSEDNTKQRKKNLLKEYANQVAHALLKASEEHTEDNPKLEFKIELDGEKIDQIITVTGDQKEMKETPTVGKPVFEKLLEKRDGVYRLESLLNTEVKAFLNSASETMSSIMNARADVEREQLELTSQYGLSFENDPIENRYREYDDAILHLKEFLKKRRVL